MAISIEDLLDIPQRFESLGGKAYAYIRREEAVYLFEDALAERDSLAAELAEVKAERDALKARLDGGVRVIAKRHPDGWIGWMECSPLHNYGDVCNANLIPDEGVTL